MKLNIAYLYQEHLNLYGDTGNVEILKFRADARNISANVLNIGVNDKINSSFFKKINILFMGGGPDAGQKDIYKDLLKNKAPYIKDFIENDGVSLFICGSYQLLGNYYKAEDASVLEGARILDLYTEQPGKGVQRCIGNTVAKLNDTILNDPVFQNNNYIGDLIVGFENHGGRTFLSERSIPFAQVLKGYGNNGDDFFEGIHYHNSIGTYFHGPILAKNPHLADYLISKSLGLDKLEKLDDYLSTSAHNTALRLRQ